MKRYLVQNSDSSSATATASERDVSLIVVSAEIHHSQRYVKCIAYSVGLYDIDQ